MIRLSISVVCYNSPLNQLQSFIDSLEISIKYLRRHYELPVIPVFMIDNSDELNALSELCSFENRCLGELRGAVWPDIVVRTYIQGLAGINA